MTPIERAVLWISFVVALVGGVYNFMAGRELTAWDRGRVQTWAQHMHECHSANPHTPTCPPISHVAPPPPPPSW